MNALLIYPEWPDTYWSFKYALPFEGKRSAYPPLGLMTVASLLPTDWKKRLVDTNIRPLTDADLRWADVAMLSGMLVHKKEILEILQRCRKRGLRTVIGGPVTSSVAELPQYADHVVIGEAEDIVADYASMSLTLGRHPMALLRSHLNRHRYLSAADLRALPDKQLARCVGLVTGRQRPGTATGVIFVTLEDETGMTNVIVHADLVERQRKELLGAQLLGVRGVVQHASDGDVVHVLAQYLVDHSELLGSLSVASRDFQ